MGKTVLFMLGCLIGTGLWSCSSDDSPPPKTAQELLTEGWQGYAGHDYQLAVDRFNAAISADGSLADAYNGSGWANAKRDLLDASVNAFNSGLLRAPSNLQMKAGYAFVLNARRSTPNHYQLSINNALAVLLADSTWKFSRDTSINASDLQLLLAEDYFAIADFNSSLIQAKALNAKLSTTFDADVTTTAGQTALANEIERLRTLF
jgi:hypothetical protein